jgi:hypothetical protein
MKITKRDLVKVLRGEITIDEAKMNMTESLLRESEPTMAMQQTDPTMYENDSVDMQIDKFLLDADPTGQKTQKEHRRDSSRLLLEAEPPPPPPAPAGAPPEGGDNVADPNAGKPKQPAKKLDLVSFASDIARLVEKSDNLLDVKGAIVRRALNYVSKNYDPKQAKDIAQILENNFGVSAEPGSDPYDDETAPNAVGAGVGLQG